jgi:hypothetical protein
MFEGVYPQGNFSWHHLWFIAYLFFLALLISPFLNFLRSDILNRFKLRIEKLASKPLALNIFLVPLLLSQILLRPYFELETNNLVSDWTSMTYYLLFFLSGFILLSVRAITEAVQRYRYWYLAEVVLITIVMFKGSHMINMVTLRDIIWDVASVILAWSCALTAIGFAKQYLNVNSAFRRLANEAIYPFYLLHQPVIVVIGFFIVRCDISVFLKAVIIIFSSFTVIALLYWFMIRPFNFLRVVFGMKILRKEKEEPETSLVLKPVIVETGNSIPGLNHESR